MSFKAVLYVDIILQKRAKKKFIIRSERKTRQKRLSNTFSLQIGHARNRKQLTSQETATLICRQEGCVPNFAVLYASIP